MPFMRHTLAVAVLFLGLLCVAQGTMLVPGSSALLLALTLCLGRRWMIFRVWNAPIP